jgi:UDP-N-acetylmuramate dehydrogenase
LLDGAWKQNGDGSVVAEGNGHAQASLRAALQGAIEEEAVEAEQPLARHTALRIGGPADLLAVVESVSELRQAVVLSWEHGVPCLVLGGGSNVLVSQQGVRGLVVLNRARAVAFAPPRSGPSQGEETSKGQVRAESGASLSRLARQCVDRGWGGLEWAAGIPGTVGGAVTGNAGAWGGNIATTLIQATVLEPGGSVVKWPVKRFAYGYRSSILKKGVAARGTRRREAAVPRAVVLDAEFALQAGDRARLQARVGEIAAQRRATQPPGATCGSVFKNPAGDYAGRLIEAAGLKGKRVGGAEISPLHANFVVNIGGATAADVLVLIDMARQEVQARFGVTLELEIELIGDWREATRGR